MPLAQALGSPISRTLHCNPICCAVLSGALAFFTCFQARAEPSSERALHAVYLEGFGAAFIWSINYELRPLSNFSIRAGYGLFPLKNPGPQGQGNYTVHYFPAMAFLLLGSGDHLLELGAGATYVTSTGDPKYPFGSAAIGLRYQPKHGGALMRVSFTPLFGGSVVMPWFGLSFGASF